MHKPNGMNGYTNEHLAHACAGGNQGSSEACPLTYVTREAEYPGYSKSPQNQSQVRDLRGQGLCDQSTSHL